MLTVGSVILAVINIGVMWAMAHQWRYAWHANLALQLLWLPYDTITKQYGLLALGTVLTFVSIKACVHGAVEKRKAGAADGRPSRHLRRETRRAARSADRRPVGERPATNAVAAPGPRGLHRRRRPPQHALGRRADRSRGRAAPAGSASVEAGIRPTAAVGAPGQPD
jgi:hypothetical protein